MSLAPRAVVVWRRTELDALVDRHGTRGQAEFFLRTRGRSLADVQARHDAQAEALAQVAQGLPADWRRGLVERAELDRFIFAGDDIVLAVGQDGLVANVAGSLAGQPVLGVGVPGPLVRHTPRQAVRLLPLVAAGKVRIEERTMVEAEADDGQVLRSLNEVYLGDPGHQTARWTLSVDGRSERQACSGLLVGTGTGATGWLRSAWQERHSTLTLPAPVDPQLAWFVREAWPSPDTRTDLVEGLLTAELELRVESDLLVVFGDGREADAVALSWGQGVRLRRSPQVLRLVVEPGDRTAPRQPDRHLLLLQ